MRRGALVLLLALLGTAGTAAGGDYGGHLKAQALWRGYGARTLGALPAGRDVDLESLDARGNAAWQRGAWDLTVQAQLDLLRGDLLAARRDARLAAAGATTLPVPIASDARQVLDLAWNVDEGDDRLLTGRLDRLSVGFSRGALTLRAGRQAASWGGGLVFQVLDLFDPFAPDALDTEYKPGVDMLSGQWLLPSGDDLQAIVVPRRADRARPLAASRSSAALKWRHFAGALQVELLAARHYRDDVAGAAASGDLAGGVWRCDLAAAFPDRGRTVASFLLNFDRTWTWSGRNVDGFVEFFRNGFGVTSVDGGLASLPNALVARIDRGELFNLGRHELAAGLTCEWSPLTKVSPTALVNLDDGSAYLLGRLEYDWRQDLELDLGAQIPVGGRGTEYGGVRVAALDAWLTPGRTAWVRVARYF